MKTIVNKLNIKGDSRGSLIALEGGLSVPFVINRVYYIYDTKPGVIRGNHAHLSLEQLLICVHGSCIVVLDDGRERVEVPLSDPSDGLYIGPMMWREMKDFSPDAVLLVLASEHYNESDYIRDYTAFLKLIDVSMDRG